MIGVGSTVGNYVVRSILGEGGMGRVWLAEHPLIGRKMAVKVIHPDFARNPEALSRFFTEAMAATRIGHAAIVDIVDYGQTPEGEAYFVMELLAGESVQQILGKRRLAVSEIIEIAYQLADAIATAHAAGILHRDLKPENVFLLPRTNGVQVKILDFGLAKLTAGDANLGHKTKIGAVMGTPCYMAPEQCAGHGNLDGRVDVYAVAVMLYEMIAGVRPFDGEQFTEILVKHLTEAPVPLQARAPECPEWLAQSVMQMLEKDPARRPFMADVATQLSTAAAAQAPRPNSNPGGRTPSYQGQRPASYQGQRPASHQGPSTTLGLGSGEPSQVHNIPKRPRRGLYVAAAIGAVVVGAGIAALTLRDPSPATAEPTPPPVATEPVAPTPTPTPAPAPAPTPPPAPVEVPLPVLPEKVTLVLESDPPGATVFVGEEKLGETPHSYDTVRGEEPLRFRFEKPGFEPRWKDITPRAGQAVSVALAPLPSAKPSGETKRRPKSPRSGDKPAPPRGGVDDDLLAPQ